MRELAAFVLSEEGKVYGGICDRWGIDPGAAFDDDVLAHNLRLGLAVAMVPTRGDSPDAEAARHADLVAAARSAAAEVNRG